MAGESVRREGRRSAHEVAAGEPVAQAPMEHEGGGPPEEPAPEERALQTTVEEVTVESLRQELEAALTEKEDQLRAWQRTQADFANYRRRVEQERAELVKNAEASLIQDLLPVVDDLERALSHLPPELVGLTWVQGIAFIERKVAAVLDLHGVKSIEALGKEFDPLEHEALLRDGEPDKATIVTAELQKGYRLHDRVIRPTLVKVGPPAENTDG